MRYLAFLLIFSACQTGEKRPPVNVEQTRIGVLVDATVKINVDCGEDSGSGSGVVISTDVYRTSQVLTAAHLDSADEAVECVFTVVNSKGKEFPAKMTKKDSKLDLMLLTVSDVVSVPTPVAMYSFVGQNVTCVGFPSQVLDDELHLSITKGQIASRFIVEDRITADIYFGSSGGPVFNDQNQVVGIVSYLIIGGISSGYPVPFPGQYFASNSVSINKFMKEPTMAESM